MGGYWFVLLVIVWCVVFRILVGLFLLGKFCLRLIVLVWVVVVDIFVKMVGVMVLFVVSRFVFVVVCCYVLGMIFMKNRLRL